MRNNEGCVACVEEGKDGGEDEGDVVVWGGDWGGGGAADGEG